MTPEREEKIITYLKRLRHEMSFTPYEFIREIKELDELIADEKPVIETIPERDIKFHETIST
jgi:hypothetical protein